MNAVPRTNFVANYGRVLSDMFQGFFGAGRDLKHNHYKDFGFPDQIDFRDAYAMYRRNAVGKAAVEKTVRKIWQDFPALAYDTNPKETAEEKSVRLHFEKIGLWRKAMDADRRSFVGRYSALILRLADSQPFDKPANRVNGLEGLVGVIPVWEEQLRVSSFDMDQTSLTYGEPAMYEFNEAALSTGSVNTQPRVFNVHPSRVVLWSQDGTIHGPLALESGYNDLLTLEKISGAGGEGFWKNAKSAPVIEIDKEANLQQMAQTMGVEVDGVYDYMNEQVGKVNNGFDELLMVQGMVVKALQVRLPSPEHFFAVALQSFASSWGIPIKVLVGTQTGERASQEDAKEWNYTCQSHRKERSEPCLMNLVSRLIDLGVLSSSDWRIKWTPLTESDMRDRLDRAYKMGDLNRMNGVTVFTYNEIREVLEYVPANEADLKPITPKTTDGAPPSDEETKKPEDTEEEDA